MLGARMIPLTPNPDLKIRCYSIGMIIQRQGDGREKANSPHIVEWLHSIALECLGRFSALTSMGSREVSDLSTVAVAPTENFHMSHISAIVSRHTLALDSIRPTLATSLLPVA